MEKIILDAGPFFALLYLVFIEDKFDLYNENDKRKILSQEAFRDEAIRNFSPDVIRINYIKYFNDKRIITTSHIIAETQNIVKNRMRQIKGFWERSIKHLKTLDFDEQYIKLMEDLAAPDDICSIFDNFGPSDAGLVLLIQKEKGTLITNDSDLLDMQLTPRPKSLYKFLVDEIYYKNI